MSARASSTRTDGIDEASGDQRHNLVTSHSTSVGAVLYGADSRGRGGCVVDGDGTRAVLGTWATAVGSAAARALRVVRWLDSCIVSFFEHSVCLTTVVAKALLYTPMAGVSSLPPPLHPAHFTSHICRLHFSNSPTRPKPSPDTHRNPARYAASPLVSHIPSSLSAGQPTNILYSYLHTNYVRPPYHILLHHFSSFHRIPRTTS